MTTKILTTVLATLTFFAVTAANSEEMPACNAADWTFSGSSGQCSYDYDFGTGSVETCAEKVGVTNTSCTSVCSVYTQEWGCLVWAHYYDSECVLEYDCDTIMGRSIKDEDNIQPMATCGGTGYCGWRDGVNKTGTSAVGNAARAKLHSCAANGKADETDYDTLSECTSNPIGQTKHAKNDYCTDSVWDTLCDGWL